MYKNFTIIFISFFISHKAFSQVQDSICKCLTVTNIEIKNIEKSRWRFPAKDYPEKNIMEITIVYTNKNVQDNYLSYPDIEYVVQSNGDTLAKKGNSPYLHRNHVPYSAPTNLEKIHSDFIGFIQYNFGFHDRWITCQLSYKSKTIK